MKQAQTSKEKQQIYKAMKPRLMELWNELVKGNYNKTTEFAYDIGFISDINDELKKLK